MQEFATVTASPLVYQHLITWVQDGATNHLFVNGPQQIKKPLQSTHAALRLVDPTPVQHKQIAAPAEDVMSDPQADLVDASYCSKELHIPDGTVGVHTVQGQEQQTLQQGQ